MSQTPTISGNTSAATRGKVLLLAMVTCCYVPVLVIAALSWSGAALAALTIPAIALVGAVLFFFPEQTLDPAYDRVATALEVRRGVLRAKPARALIDKYLVLHPDQPLLSDEAFLNSLTAWLMIRSNEPGGDAERGRLIVRWIKRGEDMVLLRNALAANFTAIELRGHLDRTKRLDPDAVATLAALIRH